MLCSLQEEVSVKTHVNRLDGSEGISHRNIKGRTFQAGRAPRRKGTQSHLGPTSKAQSPVGFVPPPKDVAVGTE